MSERDGYLNDEDLAKAEGIYGNDPDIQVAKTGADLQRVMGTVGGKYIEELAKAQIDEGIEALLEMDPYDNITKYRETRLSVLVAQQAMSWIYNGIEEGLAAVEKIHDEEAQS